MSDRTSAEIFHEIFRMLAQEATARDKEYAYKIWRIAWQYDFSWVQMECDASLVRLGLARSGRDETGFPVHEYADTQGRLL